MRLRVRNQSWQTGPNESALHFKAVFFSLLTSNWEVSTGRSLNSFLIISEITKHIVIISFIEDSETSLLIEKHTLRVLYNLKKIFAKFGFRWFIYVIVFNLLHFWSLLTTYAVAYCHTHLWITDQSWQDWSK